MKNIRVNKVINLLIEFCYLGIIFLIPIFFGLWPKTSDVFSLPKIILFKILLLLLLFLSIIKFIFYKNIFLDFLKRIKKNFIIFVVPLFFLLTLTISTLLSSYPRLSFYGLYGRQMGLVSYIYFILFYFLLVANIKAKAQIKRVIAAAAWSSVAVCAYALAQAAGLDPLHWIESTQIRAASTFGQPNILGAYLLLVIPLAAYLALRSKNWAAKIIYFLILSGQLLSLFFTYSLSSWAGLIGGVIIGGIIALFYVFKNLKVKPLTRGFQKVDAIKSRGPFTSVSFVWNNKIKIIFLFIFLFFILSFGFNLYKKSPRVLKAKINFLMHPNSGSLAARQEFWRAGWQAIKKKPFLGYGLDTQGEVLLSYYAKDWGIFNNVNVRPNRAHNLFLDIMLTGGLLGLAAYLALLYLFFRLIFENIKSGRGKKFNIALAIATISYFIFLQFNFSFITGEIYFWAFFALVTVLFLNKENKINPDHKAIASSFSAMGLILRILLIILIAFPIFYEISREIKKLEADHYWYSLRVARVVHNDFFEGKVLNDYIRDLKINDVYYEKQYAIMLADWVSALDQYGIIFRRVSDERIFPKILPNISESTYDDYLARGRSYVMLAQAESGHKKDAYFKKAWNNLEKLISLSPEMPKNYRELADMYFKKEDYQKAIDNYNLSLDKLPKLNSPGLNNRHKARVKGEMRLNYQGLSSAYGRLGNKNKEEEYKKILRN